VVITPGLFALAATLVVTLLLHPIEALDEWVEEWTAQAIELGETVEWIAEYTDMATRHPAFFGRPVPVKRTVSKVLTRSPSIGTVPAGVEGWRSLVAAHWPADLVDTALCIIDKESQGLATADNPRSTARGLFQVLRSWPIAFGYTYADLYDPAINAIVAYRVYQIQGWRAWTVHHQCGV
jgi:hypothetical protein